MRKYVRTPSGILGVITLVLVLALGIVSILYAVSTQASAKRTECIARELAQPWLGLKESFGVPPGDAAARERALTAIKRGIDRLNHLDDHC